MVFEKSCGAIVFRKFHGNVEILLIKHDNGGHWSFPKGHVEKDETELETAKREIMEETGITVMLDQTFREVVTYYPKRESKKEVVYFIGKALNVDCVPKLEEISEVKWVQLESSYAILTYENDRQLLSKATPYLKEGI